MDRLVLIDGNAMLHRAYHALPPLTSPDGLQVNAVYGFTAMLIRLVIDLKPTQMAVAFDRAAPTFRKKLYKEYQATRPKMEEALVSQIDLVHELVAAFEIPIFELDGYEADDVIGTIVEKVKNDKADQKNQAQVIIVTGDRDILQLVEEGKVLVYMPTKGLSEGKLYGEKEVVGRMGVIPKLIPDLKALTGDSSDNYPGVAGIGSKTAISLILKYGDIKGIYRNLKEFRGKKPVGLSQTVVDKVKNGKEAAELSYDLATIRRDVPITVDIDELHLQSLDTPKVHAFLEKLHFYSLLKRLGKEENGEQKDQKEKRDKKNRDKENSKQQSLF